MFSKNMSFMFFKAVSMALMISFSLPALAVTSVPDIGQMFSNFSDSSIQLMRLVSGTAFVVGLLISAKAALSFKEYAESGGRTQLKTPLGLMVAGIFLVAFPGTINMATETLSLGANTGSILSESGGGGGQAGAMIGSAMTGVLLFVKLVGHIAIFRGILILKKAAEGQQGGEIGRALTHIFGGAAAVNINAAIDMLGNSVGMSLPI